MLQRNNILLLKKNTDEEEKNNRFNLTCNIKKKIMQFRKLYKINNLGLVFMKIFTIS